MKPLTIIALLFWFVASAMAQVNVTLAWDASATPSLPDNPIKYRLYNCSDQALTVCSKIEVGTGLQYGPIALSHGSTTYFYVTAWNLSTDSETGGVITPGVEQESPKSNILRVRAYAPPGNPKNNRIVVTQIGSTDGGPMLLASN